MERVGALHVTVHRLAPAAAAPGSAPPAGGALPIGERLAPLAVDFERLAETLGARDDLVFEPDGSFVWRTPDGQLDGQLFDGPGGLQYVEVRGTAARGMWEQLAGWLSAPGDELAVQLVEIGKILPESEFRKTLADRGC